MKDGSKIYLPGYVILFRSDLHVCSANQCQCESISSRTGCWLYLAIQHPNSRTPFTHFTSRKLRNEAPEQVVAIHELSSQMMAALTRADRRSKVEAEMAQVNAEKRAVEEGERADAAERRVAMLEADLEARERILADLFKH
jgi:hypothetical protein